MPSPSRPKVLAPQQYATPARAQVDPPAVIPLAALSPATATGTARSSRVPSPSWPAAFRPQHQDWPERTAQVNMTPAVSAVTSPLIAGTGLGSDDSPLAPSPN